MALGVFCSGDDGLVLVGFIMLLLVSCFYVWDLSERVCMSIHTNTPVPLKGKGRRVARERKKEKARDVDVSIGTTWYHPV